MPPDPEMQPIISVIIPVYNGQETLPACLRGLQHQTRPPDEIIVVDDGSNDSSAGLAAQFGVTVMRQTNAGPAAARNRGAQAARGHLLLFTDADCIPAPAWVERLAAVFSDPSVAGAKGEYRSVQPELAARLVQQEYQDRYDRMAHQPQIDFVDTYSAAYRREVFLQSGGFDTTFPTASVEDQEFSFRLAAQGYRLVYAPGAVVYHRHDRTLGEYARRKFWIGYWKARVTRRYPAKLVHDSHTPQLLKAQIALVALGGGLFLVWPVFQKSLFWRSGLLAWAVFLLSGVPFYIKILRRDPAVCWAAPLHIFVRAWALGCGFLLGNLRFLYSNR